MITYRRVFQFVIILVVAIVSISLAGGLWKGSSARKAQDAQQVGASRSEMKLSDIEFTEMDKGKRFWTLRASEAVYHHDQQVTQLKSVHLTFHLENGEGQIILESRDGMLHAGTKNIELRNDVRATLPRGYSLKTESANYDHQARKVSSNEAIVVSGPAGTVDGKVWEYRIPSHEASLVGVSAKLNGAQIKLEKF